MINFALAGNQNCGKTTLFNCLTGSNQHVGNFPGVTVDSKIGSCKGYPDCRIVDLPGIYSIRPYTGEEIVTRDFLLSGNASAIINIVDATNIERNLYLTLQLLELRIPTVLALNMMDEVRGNGGSINIQKLSEQLGIPVVPISAAKNEGITELMDQAVAAVRTNLVPKRVDFCHDCAVHRCIHAVAHVIEDHAAAIGVPARFAATKIIEGDAEMTSKLKLSVNELELIEHSVIEMETEGGLDRNAAIASMRYDFIQEVCDQTVVKCHESKERTRSIKIDSVLTDKYLALPIFFGIMFLIFYLTFGLVGEWMSQLIDSGIGMLSDTVSAWLTDYGINPVVHSLVVDGIFAGVGSVISFLPYIIVLFFLLSILEDTGYMARVAFVMDRLLRKIGLSGRSFVPMLIGFGCSVPAIMATRTLSSERDRKMTLMLIPFMSCSAKIPIYAVFSVAFFPQYAAFVMIALYIGGMVTGILMALILKSTAFRGKPVPFVMELPNYRFPSPKSVFLLLWDKTKDFITRAFTVIFLATVLIWFLRTFDLKFNIAATGDESILAQLAQLITPLFRPIGLDDWRIVTSLISGLTAKEAVVSTLGVLVCQGGELLQSVLPTMLTVPAACSFLAFTLLYTPCVAAIATYKKEFGSVWRTVGVVLLQCGTAWVVALLVYRLALLF